MTINRREFVRVGVTGSSAWLIGRSMAAASVRSSEGIPLLPGPTFKMRVRDGYAYMVSRTKKSVLVGAIDHTSKPHPLILYMPFGTAMDMTPFKPVPDKPRQWDCSGWHVELDLGKTAKPLTIPKESWPSSTEKCPASTEWNNLAWLPPASKVYPQVSLKRDWPKWLTSRLVFRQGMLKVGESASTGIWRFRDKRTGKERWVQPMSNFTDVNQTLAEGTTSILLNVFERKDTLPTSQDSPKYRIEITPEKDQWDLQFAVEHGVKNPGSYEIGAGVLHFDRYRDLLDLGTDDRHIIPYFYECVDGGGSCPGDFCPYLRFEL